MSIDQTFLLLMGGWQRDYTCYLFVAQGVCTLIDCYMALFGRCGGAGNFDAVWTASARLGTDMVRRRVVVVVVVGGGGDWKHSAGVPLKLWVCSSALDHKDLGLVD